MNFLTPAFFLGALALAVPVLVHLTNRERKDVVEFPSLMFLRRIPYRSVKRQKLRHLLLFSLRCLALLLLVLAFARPFFSTNAAATSSVLGPRELVVVVDHSYSMGYADRLSEAKAEAGRLMAGLGPEERGSVIIVSDRAEILAQSSADPLELASALDGISLSAQTTRFGPGLKLAQKIVDESDLGRKHVVLLSDFQRLGWDGDEDVWLPSGTELTTVDLGSEDWTNLTITDVILEREPASGRERLTVSARLTYKAPPDAGPVTTGVGIELNSRSLQNKDIELAPNSSTTVSFEPFTLPSGMARGTVRLDDDGLIEDNAYHFVLWPGQSLSVLVLEGPRRRSLYLDRALSIGDRPSFRVERKRRAEFGAGDLNGRQVVVLNDVRSVSDNQARLLERFVEGGGGLIVVLGEASGRNTFSGAAASLLPAPTGPSADRSRDWGGTLSFLDYDTPVFDVFSAPHSGDFSTAKFFRYRIFDAPVVDGVLARFDDGAVALAEKRIGDGRVLVWTSTLDTFWNDLPRQPVFLPFAHQLVKYSAGYAEANPWHVVGEVADVARYLETTSLGSAESEEDWVIESPSEERIVIPTSEERPLLPLTEHGFYQIRRAGSEGSQSAVSLASNLDTAESDLAPIDPEELVASVGLREQIVADATDAGRTPADQESRQSYWWYVLLAAFALLMAESILSNRMSRRAATVGGV